MKRLVILGGGESGTGAAILAKRQGFDVFLSDMGTIAPRYIERLKQYDIPFEHGAHTEHLILNADEVVKSPGIPDSAPIIQKLKQRNTHIISEIEFASRYTDARMVCITGSNGKTTTTMLTYTILKNAGLNVGLAGNVGFSLALQVATDPKDIYVIELSSFQLDNMYDFRANIAILLNITPDHLDRYDYKMQNYVNAKFRILQNQTRDDAFVYWHDCPTIARQLQHVAPEATQYPFAEHPFAGCAACVQNNDFVVDIPGHQRLAIPRNSLALKGLHNLYNSMAAAIAATLLDIDTHVIAHTLQSFAGVEHRLETIATINGVRYINDSKATNVDSTWYALQAMTTPVVLILGGKDKGNDYSQILPLVQQHVKTIVAMGKDNNKIIDFFSPHVTVVDTHSLDDAIAACRAAASDGDTVLLSPCCASFDLFRSYEDRGDKFRNAVLNIKD